ncbi:MAG TPA: hypothetical protein VEI82_05825, partial [Myxococcota bacterium]|nr:hypothetical protein [Myxococcota bacterium]
MEAGCVVEVAVPLPLDETLRYSLAPDADPLPEPGTRVLVECGGRKLTGVVVRAQPAARAAEDLRPVLRTIDASPALPP